MLSFDCYDDQTIKDFRFNEQFWDNKKRNLFFYTCQDFYNSKHENNFYLFKPVNNLMNSINSQVEKLNEFTIGIHIRQTDHYISIRNSPVELFYNQIEKILKSNANTVFYLATDSQEVENKLILLFGNNVIRQENKPFERNSQKGVEHALIDLYALSKTKKILGSYWCSFSYVPSLKNNIPFEIVK